MGIVGNRPETGLRITLRRQRVVPTDPPVRARYEGEIVAPDGASERFVAVIQEGGTVLCEGAISDAHAKRVALLIRTILRECERDGRTELPTKIVRWWGEK